ncbi:MAG: zinc-finger domain-containing protein [Dongiaceae bacterium]
MIEPLETIETDRETVACDGGDGPLGHPRVYLHIGAPDRGGVRWVECPYCSRRYVLKAGRTQAAH